METDLTAWGRWIDAQPRGTMRKAELATGLAYSTIHYARKRRTSRDVAELLSTFARGAVRVNDIAKPRRQAGRQRKAAA